MAYSGRMQGNHLYSILLAPRGRDRMVDLGMQIAGHYLSPFDKLIGFIGSPGSGKSMLIKGMFPGLELTSDDSGVNIRPLPLLSVHEHTTGFYTPHTYHVDIHFEAAFTPMFELAIAITDAINLGKRVVVEHFDLIREHLTMNANLLIGIGEEVIITRPSIFGPEPAEVAKIVHKTLNYRFMAHTAVDLCSVYLQDKVTEHYLHADVRHGFILSFQNKPDIDLTKLENYLNNMISQALPVSLKDENHIQIGKITWPCTAPRMHVKKTSDIKKFTATKEIVQDPLSKRWLLTGIVGDKVGEFNKIIAI